ncbi:MAG: hypothetical protein HC836_44630 [Richelia sp. RM2_1_2]|nr:hypothetical protein [Richelia sp. SM1_7_0]NJN09430.1 hypothetical protein [Richelia sp. RM1_1_1]NJO29418.1 hypothetical protein [Richelia sp. SL_2_1]NJO64953.1 hypothetical protein [Richelia sp. RM2_1_2]
MNIQNFQGTSQAGDFQASLREATSAIAISRRLGVSECVTQHIILGK